MSVVIALIGVGVLLGLLLLFVVLLRSSRPTLDWQRVPKEAEIRKEADDVQKRVEEQARKDREEVAHAKQSGKLVDLVRRRLFGAK